MARLFALIAFTLATWMASAHTEDTPAPFDCNAPTDYDCTCELKGEARFDIFAVISVLLVLLAYKPILTIALKIARIRRGHRGGDKNKRHS